LTCTVDQIASAADLVKGKLNGLPVAILRGLSGVHDAETATSQGISALVRPVEEDMFSLGTRDVLRARVDTVQFVAEPVDPDRITRALQAASLAARPAGWDALRFAVLPDVPAALRAEMRAELHAELPATATAFIVPYLVTLPTTHDLLAAGAAIENVLVALAVEQVGSFWVWLPAQSEPSELAAILGIDNGYLLGLIAVGRPAV